MKVDRPIARFPINWLRLIKSRALYQKKKKKKSKKTNYWAKFFFNRIDRTIKKYGSLDPSPDSRYTGSSVFLDQ